MRVEVPASRSGLWGVTLGSLAFVLAGILLIAGWQSGDGSLFEAVVGVASIAFFGLCGTVAAARLVKRTPAVVIDDNGVVDNASGVSVGFIPWAEIKELRKYHVAGQVFLGIVPRNLDAIIARQPAWKRAVIRMNQSMGAMPINIPQTMLPMPVADLIRDMKVHMNRSRW